MLTITVKEEDVYITIVIITFITIITLKMSSVGSLLGREPGAKEDDVGMKYCGSLNIMMMMMMMMMKATTKMMSMMMII